jgi:hypothetical protein
MKGLSRKKFSEVGCRLFDWFSAARHSTLPERLNYRCHSWSRVAHLTRELSTVITWQPIHSILPKLFNANQQATL